METQAQQLFDEAVKQAWTEEIDRRIVRYESGESRSVPMEEVWPAIAGEAWRADRGELT